MYSSQHQDLYYSLDKKTNIVSCIVNSVHVIFVLYSTSESKYKRFEEVSSQSSYKKKMNEYWIPNKYKLYPIVIIKIIPCHWPYNKEILYWTSLTHMLLVPITYIICNNNNIPTVISPASQHKDALYTNLKRIYK